MVFLGIFLYLFISFGVGVYIARRWPYSFDDMSLVVVALTWPLILPIIWTGRFWRWVFKNVKPKERH